MSKQIARMEARRFDLDWIIENDRWEVEMLRRSDRPEKLVSPLQDSPRNGRAVARARPDVRSRVPKGEGAESALWSGVDRLEQHLGMVFHRFIEGDLAGSRRKPLMITLNGNSCSRGIRLPPSEPKHGAAHAA